MRYPASEKLEIILIVEQSHLPAKRGRSIFRAGISKPVNIKPIVLTYKTILPDGWADQDARAETQQPIFRVADLDYAQRKI